MALHCQKNSVSVIGVGHSKRMESWKPSCPGSVAAAMAFIADHSISPNQFHFQVNAVVESV
jgi:hypothetical protein